ncbi:hypothetical protein GQ457_01G022800 [Hibiscus cannabinus]
MPKYIFQKLGIGHAKPTTIMLQLVDRSYVKPEGKIEDILVRVDKFIFPADFLILDCEADEHVPIILGIPFLAIGRVLIDFERDTVNRRNLLPKSKLWIMFIKRNIVLKSHKQSFDKERMVLIHVILIGTKSNVGQVIAMELSDACKTDRAILAFPYLISTLFRASAVPTRPTNKYTQFKTSWARKDYMKKMDLTDAIHIRMTMPAVGEEPNIAQDANSPAPAGEEQPTPAATLVATPVHSLAATSEV